MPLGNVLLIVIFLLFNVTINLLAEGSVQKMHELGLTDELIEKINRDNQKLLNDEYLRKEKAVELLTYSKPVFLQPRFDKEYKLEILPKEKGLPDVMVRCIPLRQFRLLNARLFADELNRLFIEKYQYECIDSTIINNALREVTNYYVDRGFITSRAYLPEQNISSGTLSVKVLEGVIDQLYIQPEPRALLDAEALFAFGAIEGGYLNLRDLEQGVENLNRLPSNSAKMDIKPSDKNGQSVVVINNKKTKKYRLGVNSDNINSSNEKFKNSYSFDYDNLIGINDMVMMTYSEDKSDEQGQKYNESKSINFVFPYQYHTVTYSYSDFIYDNTINGDVKDFHSTGTSITNKYDLESTWYRSAGSKLKTKLNFTFKKTENYIEDILLETSSLTLNTLGIGVNYFLLSQYGQWTIDLSTIKGVNWFGEVGDSSALPVSQNPEFLKYLVTLNYGNQVKIFSEVFSVSSKVSYQTTGDELYSSEQMGLGGFYTIRGFKSSTTYDNHGFYWRNDLAKSFLVNKWFIKNVSTYIGFDFGKNSRIDQPGIEGMVSGSVLGTNIAHQYGTISVAIGIPLSRPEGIAAEEVPVYASIQLKI